MVPAAMAQDPAAVGYVGEDLEKIVTAEACGECHVSAYAVWKKTSHQEGFRTLHRTAAAAAILERMDLRLSKRDSLCLSCHYTATLQGAGLRAVSGVSCESCHGAARDWLDVHNDYGGTGIDHTSESDEHRLQRVETSLQAGMRRPTENLYALMSSCFRCHTVPNEKLVNVGGHGTGSSGFELAAWSAGEIRHNLLDSFRSGDGTINVEQPMSRTRQLYALGRALDLEHGLRGIAEATENGVFAKAMSRRVRGALREIQALQRRLDNPELALMIATVRAAEVLPNRRRALLQAADEVGAATRRFLRAASDEQLASLDGLILGTAEDEVIADQESGEDGGAASDAVADSTLPGSGQASAGGGEPAGAAGQDATVSTTAPAKTLRSAVPAAGTLKRRIRPASQHPTVGPDRCASCHRHQPQAAWWFDDPHSVAVNPFFDQAPANVKIATLYGLKRSQMARGDQVCMDCHGTAVSGQETREVADGVGCEGCHGAAGDYLEPHQEGDPSLGTNRAGYRQALGLGMVEMRDIEVRARVCTGCHYITEPRLISSGHPSGIDFDYVRGMGEIKHWQAADTPPDAVRAAIESARGSRGPVPEVRRARLAETIDTSPGSVSGAESASAAQAASSGAGGRRVDRPKVPRARPRPPGSRVPAPRAAVGGAAGVELPPFPQIDEDMPIEALLLLLKDRLALLYESVGEGARPPGGNR